MMNIGLKNMQGGLNHHFLNEVKFNLEYCCDPWDFQGVYDKLSSQQYGKKPSRGCPIIILLIPLAQIAIHLDYKNVISNEIDQSLDYYESTI